MRASSLLKRSDHFWSNPEILLSAEENSTDFLGLAGILSFFGFFSGGAEDAWVLLESPTTPITDTPEGSTRELSSVGLELSVHFA